MSPRRFSAYSVHALCTLCASLFCTVPAQAAPTLHEVLTEDVGGDTYVRFRFLTPEIARDGGTLDADAAEAQVMQLCTDLALPYIEEYALKADTIVLSLMDRIVPFGEADADATQFFYQFRPENGTCIWEDF